MENAEIVVSAPGRLCLFGEHQDYFGLPVIAAAINLRIRISGKRRDDPKFVIQQPDIDARDEFDLKDEIKYTRKRDYLKSVIVVLRRRGISFPYGWECLVKGTIPINSGTSSSSALVVAWIKFLLEAAGHADANSPETIAELAFQAEVAEFNEPGGKMDHYTCALGGVVNIQFSDKLRVNRLHSPLREFVLADSMIKKDTRGTLDYIKSRVFSGVKRLQKRMETFHLNGIIGEREKAEMAKLPANSRRLIEGTLKTRDLTSHGESLFQTEPFEHERFGEMLNRQQDVLRNYLSVSSPKLDRMIDTALEAGALGAKINGSGEGGCIFAYCPEKSGQVAEALRRTGAKVSIVHVDEGVRLESL